MTSRDFCYWLQGHFEISAVDSLGPKETDTVKRHLALVFKHEIDPSMGGALHQEQLNQIHSALSMPPKGDGGETYRC